VSPVLCCAVLCCAVPCRYYVLRHSLHPLKDVGLLCFRGECCDPGGGGGTVLIWGFGSHSWSLAGLCTCRPYMPACCKGGGGVKSILVVDAWWDQACGLYHVIPESRMSGLGSVYCSPQPRDSAYAWDNQWGQHGRDMDNHDGQSSCDRGSVACMFQIYTIQLYHSKLLVLAI